MPEMKRILFVDDEPNILDGLRRMLRTLRSEWEMSFADDGEQALRILAERPHDVIVSDLRMPGMSGERLLGEVRLRYPTMVRLVLSGQADRDSLAQSVGPIHQFLQKPCDEVTLKATIRRTIELGDLFADPELKRMVTELESLPTLPAHHAEMMHRLRMPAASPKFIGEAIGKDMGMTAKILQLVNSAFIGVRRHVASPADAVRLLGVDTVRALVETMQIFSRVSGDGERNQLQYSLLAHGAAVADAARRIALNEGASKEEADAVYTAGLLHDVGKLVLSASRPESFAQALAVARAESIPAPEAERRIIGATHAEVGGYLLGLWAFPNDVVDAALYHHEPKRHRGDGFAAVTAVHVANAIVHGGLGARDPANLDVDRAYLEALGLDDRLAVWLGAQPAAA